MRIFAEKLQSVTKSPQRPPRMVLPIKTFDDACTSPCSSPLAQAQAIKAKNEKYREELQRLESMYRKEVDNYRKEVDNVYVCVCVCVCDRER
jgi:hypothetical protein